MTDRDDNRLEELKRYIERLSDAERRRQLEKTRGAEGLARAVRRGDAVAIACAAREGRKLDAPDRNGMTPLHHAAAYDARLIGTLLTERTDGAQWHRDRYSRLPLDLARQSGNHEIGDRLERITYPELFRDERDGPVPPELIAEHDRQRQERGSPDTRPDFAREFPARGILREGGERGDHSRDR